MLVNEAEASCGKHVAWVYSAHRERIVKDAAQPNAQIHVTDK